MMIASAARGLMFSLVALPLLACESPTSAAEEADRLIVDTVEVRVTDALPVQVRASVKGHLRDECEMVGDTTQSRSGYTITVTISTTRDNERERPCVQETLAVEKDVLLEGPFPPGAYVVRVNGVEQTFRVD